MISVLGQQLWKNKLVSGVLAWPGPSILVVSIIFGVA